MAPGGGIHVPSCCSSFKYTQKLGKYGHFWILNVTGGKTGKKKSLASVN